MNEFLPPAKAPKHPISNDGLQIIRDIFSGSSYNGYILLAKKGENGFREICYVRQNDLVDYMAALECYPDNSYYLSPAGFSKMERSTETIFCANAIVIDIDCHAHFVNEAERDELIDRFLWRLFNDWGESGDEELVTPRHAILTGRGTQLWWPIVPVHAPSFLSCLSDVTTYFIDKIQEMLDEFPEELGGLEIDKAASLNPIGLFRVPGTMNPRVGKQVTAWINGPDKLDEAENGRTIKRLDIKKYRDKYLPYHPSKEETYRLSGIVPVQVTTDGTTDGHCLDALAKLRNMRAVSAGEELRNNFIFLYYAIAKNLYSSDDVAMQMAENFNSGFQKPMTPKEIKSTLSSAKRKDYKIGFHKIIELLDVSDEEAKLISLAAPSHSVGNPQKSDKTERDTKILELALSGLKQEEIANTLNISKRTVITVLKEKNIKGILTAQIKLLFDQGMAVTEIAERMRCTTRTIYNHLAAAKQMDSSDLETCEKKCKIASNNGLILFHGRDGNGAVSAAVEAEKIRLDFLKQSIQKHLETAVHEGSLCLPEAIIVKSIIRQHKNASSGEVTGVCRSLADQGTLRITSSADRTDYFYLPENFDLETTVLMALESLIRTEKLSSISVDEINGYLSLYEQDKKIILSPEQKNAVITAIKASVCVITGGPGTGKTSVLDAIGYVLKCCNSNITYTFCAFTGKAALRLEEATGHRSSTIHSLIKATQTGRLKADYIFIDEASMVSMPLFAELLEKVDFHTRLILVGDPEQLPCIGTGNLLDNLISSASVPVVRLKSCFRQNQGNGVLTFANQIRNRINPADIAVSLDTSLDNDVCLRYADSIDSIVKESSKVIDAVKKQGYKPEQIQVLTPIRCLAEILNGELRHLLNNSKAASSADSADLTVGDRVIYTVNDYRRNLRNGSVGIIRSIDWQYVTVEYNNHVVRHNISEIDAKLLHRAYALTVHKSQGSEYPVVIVPVLKSMRNINRNLIYTALTRAKEKCIFVGSQEALIYALNRSLEGTHLSLLGDRLSQLFIKR